MYGHWIGQFLNLSPYQGDSDGVSVVSSDCGVNGGGRVNGEFPLCILSPDCELFICDGDNDSTDRYGNVDLVHAFVFSIRSTPRYPSCSLNASDLNMLANQF